MKLQELIRDGYLFLDGAMGTELQAAGLKLGERPELLCFTEPDTVAAIHRSYLAAGSQIIYSNTFQANGHKLGRHRLHARPGDHSGCGSGQGRRRGHWMPSLPSTAAPRDAAGAAGHPAL